jgi:hypothetical protein
MVCTQQAFAVTGMQMQRDGEGDRPGKQSAKGRAQESEDGPRPGDPGRPSSDAKGTVTVVLELRGGRSVARLVDKLSEINGVTAVSASDPGSISD